MYQGNGKRPYAGKRKDGSNGVSGAYNGAVNGAYKSAYGGSESGAYDGTYEAAQNGAYNGAHGAVNRNANGGANNSANGAGRAGRVGKRTNRKTLLWGRNRTRMFNAEDIEVNKGYAVAASLGLTFFVPLAAAPDSKFGQYWANQGLLLDIVMVAAGLVSLIGGGILSLLGLIPYIGILFRILRIVLFVILGLLLVLLIARNCYLSSKGIARDLPVIGYIRIINYK